MKVVQVARFGYVYVLRLVDLAPPRRGPSNTVNAVEVSGGATTPSSIFARARFQVYLGRPLF